MYLTTEPAFLPLTTYREYSADEMKDRIKTFRGDMLRPRTVRQFSSRPVPREVIEDCLRITGTLRKSPGSGSPNFRAQCRPAVRHLWCAFVLRIRSPSSEHKILKLRAGHLQFLWLMLGEHASAECENDATQEKRSLHVFPPLNLQQEYTPLRIATNFGSGDMLRSIVSALLLVVFSPVFGHTPLQSGRTQPQWNSFAQDQQSASGNAPSCVKDYLPSTPVEAELVQVENEWCEAAVHRDPARLERIFADDISWLEDVGYRNKAQVMHRYMVEIQEHMWELKDVRIRVIGNVGIVSSHIHVKKTAAGGLTESDHTSVDVFEKRAGRWQLVAE